MRILCLLFVSVLLSACADPCLDEVISKAMDPQQKTMAFYVRRYAHHIYIAVPGASYEGLRPIFVADKVKNLSLAWLDAQTLGISYDSARIFNFTNFWQSAEVDNFTYIIHVKLNED